MPEIHFNHLSFSYRSKAVFNDFSASFRGPGVFLLTGPSGCGKTTLLRLAAGLLKPGSGSVSVSDPVAFAFQEYRLFPTLSALENVTCVRNPGRGDEAANDEREALELLQSLGLKREEVEFLPDALSGGMKQRVSLARALFSPHPIKLLDEVTKELDQASVSRALEAIRRSSEESLILFSTHRPEDLDGFETTLVELGCESKNNL